MGDAFNIAIEIAYIQGPTNSLWPDVRNWVLVRTLEEESRRTG